MQITSTYLRRLKFDPKLKSSLIAKYLSNRRFLSLLTLIIIILGLTSYLNLPRLLNPQIKIPIVIISTILQGASPKDVESLVTIPIEDSVIGLENIKQVSSSSRDSISLISLEFNSGVDPDKARSDVQSAVDGVTLPEDALSPRIQKLDFENQPVWTFNLSGKADVGSLNRFALKLKEDIYNLATVDEVDLTGGEEQEIRVLIKQEALSTYSINPIVLSQVIKNSLSSFPAGVVKTEKSFFSLSIDPSILTVEDVRNLKLNLSGNIVNLSQVATISQNSSPDKPGTFFADRETAATKSINFNVFKTATANVDKTVSDVEDQIEKTSKDYKGQFKISSLINTGEEIKKQFSDLTRDFFLTVSLVFLTLLIFLGARQAIVASFSTPLTFFISFTVMNATGITLNFISLFSLLLSLGLLVDDTIVVISAMTQYYRSGKFTPLQTGLLVWRDFLAAILTTTITTVWAFIPLLLSTGIIGEFIKPIPIVVSSTLLASLGVALFITLPFIIFLLKPQIPRRVSILIWGLIFILVVGAFAFALPKNNLQILEFFSFILFLGILLLIRGSIKIWTYQFISKGKRQEIINRGKITLGNGLFSFENLSRKYKGIIDRILASSTNRKKIIAMVVIFSLFSYLLFPLGFVKNEFFPKSDQPFIYIALEMPSGSNLASTTKVITKLMGEIRENEEIKYLTGEIGRGFSTMSGAEASEGNNALLTLVLKEENERDKSSIEIAEGLRTRYSNFQEGKIQIVEITGGPPAGADLQLSLLGEDLQVLNGFADKIQEFLRKQIGITNVDKSIKPGTSKVVFDPDEDKLQELGITIDQVGLLFRTFASGFSADSIKLEEEVEDQDIKIRLTSTTPYIETLTSLSLPTPEGAIPVSSLGSFKLEANPTLITREDGKRTLAVTAGVLSGYSVTDKNKELENFATSLDLPEGYSWKTGGINEENQRSVTSILQAMVLSFLLIIITMVIQFGSFRKALIVMLVIPLSISGVFIIFALTKTPLSFPALIGVLALFGIVVKNSILVVDKINSNLKTGMDFREAIADASSSRLEAIALTSLATTIGLIPITLSNPLWRGLGGAIIAGLTFSGTIMLFFIPVVYYMFFVSEEGKSRKTKL